MYRGVLKPERRTGFMIALLLVTACGGQGGVGVPTTNSPPATTTATDARAGDEGDVVNPQPPGQANAVVDGLEYTLTEPGAVGCNIGGDSVAFSFRIGDNEVTLGGGASLSDGTWFGALELVVANPEGENGPISYYPDLSSDEDGLAVAGSSMSYSGPMLKQPAQDGSNPPPVDVGEGTISVTCA